MHRPDRQGWWRVHGGQVGAVALALVIATTVDQVLTRRAAAGTDTAQNLAPLYSYLGVDRVYIAARALGITALVCAALATALGLTAAGRGRPTWAAAASRLHRALSLLTIVLVAAHATLPYASVYPPFGGWATATVPLAQPYSFGRTAQWAESAGIVAFYLMLLVGPSYYLARRWRRGWATVHRMATGTYLLAVVHTLLLGSDFLVRGAPRVVLIAVQVPLLLLLAGRIRRAPRGMERPDRRVHRPVALARRVAEISVWLLAAGCAAAAVAGAWGAGLGGFPLPGGG